MASNLLECVPNFSEGRDRSTIEALAAVFRSSPHVTLLDVHSDPFHHRSVYTVVGEPRALSTAVLQATSVAVERIDLTRHTGEHPRVGAADVIPFISLGSTPIEIATATAISLGERIGSDLGIPVYLYGSAARHPNRITLPAIRRTLLTNTDNTGGEARSVPPPDLGPSLPHPTAGAAVVGARDFLVAFNVQLDTRDVHVARQIAARVRSANGGPPGIRALGFLVDGRAQVSMNLYDLARSTPLVALRLVQSLARKAGVEIVGCELVGLMPEIAAADVSTAADLMLSVPLESVILERRLSTMQPVPDSGA